MTTGDMPSISNTAHTHSVYSGHDLLNQSAAGVSSTSLFNTIIPASDTVQNQCDYATAMRRINTRQDHVQLTEIPQPQQEQQMTKRVVQVYIIDPSDQVPLEDSMVYMDAAPHLTDLTDQELFFEIDIKGKLAAHNAKRVILPPVKVRDLKMTVVEIAVFDKK